MPTTTMTMTVTYTCVICGTQESYEQLETEGKVNWKKDLKKFAWNGHVAFSFDGFDWQGSACTRVETKGEICDICAEALSVLFESKKAKAS